MTRRVASGLAARVASGLAAVAAVAGALGALAAQAAQAAQAAESPAAASDCPAAPAPLDADLLRAGLANAKDHGFLWRITKDGRSSYLYGTIHAAKYEWMFPGPTVIEALDASDTVALELDILEPDIQQRLAESIKAAPGKPTLPAALARRLEKRMVDECIDVAAWQAYTPEFQIASLTVMAARRDGFDPSYAIDLVLDIAAHQRGKPVVSLETPESQMKALRSSTPAETTELVRAGLDDLDSGRARPLLERLANAWVDGDYADLSRYRQWCNCVRTPNERKLMKRLLDDRNPALAAAIDEMHRSGKQVFAAVGSLHMIGPGGLPALMKQRGYKIEQGDFTR